MSVESPLLPSQSSAAWREGYAPPPTNYDEWVDADGQPRAHTRRLDEAFARLGPAGLDARHEQARRALKENGVTYNVYGDPAGMDRVLRFDPVPLVIPADEWAELEAGLRQRAQLLNAVLTDLYGPQRLLREGVLPAALVYGNAGYWPPCQGLRPAADVWLHLCAVDLARSPDGRWWALNDRTQAPSGAGYALESRVIMNRALPDELRELRVRRLAAFFRHWREGLAAHARPERAHPRIVILTPGPLNETYFEHAYLSRYLGFPLVQGDDLTVRDHRVFLKTLEGLQPVDVIVRRVDDAFCDPLELRGDSFLGVPGLLEAARAGTVAVANAIGSGLVESPALLAFLPTLCTFLLGETLRLPSVATWWCGQPKERAEAQAGLERLVIKSARAGGAREPVFGGDLPPAAREEWRGRLERQPWAFLAQENLRFSTAPVWNDSRLEPRQIGLRAFVARGPEGWVVMPGGLTRVASRSDSRVVSMQAGGAGKDTWVLSDRPVAHASLIAPVTPLPAHARAEAGLPSRVGDHLFWLGRYAERLENLARALRAVLSRLSGEAGDHPAADGRALARILRAHELTDWEETPPESLAARLEAITRDPDLPRGLHAGLLNVRRAAWMVRERLSTDTWRILGELQTAAQTPGAGARLDRVILYLGAFSGMEMENMVRDYGWRFLDLGRRLERADLLLRAVSAGLEGGPAGPALLDVLLETADSTMTYRRRYFAPALPVPVLDLLLLDDTNPRSLAFQLQRLQEHLDVLAKLPGHEVSGRKGRLLDALRLRLRNLHLERRAGSASGCAELVELAAEGGARMWELSDLVTQTYFAHAVSRAR
jgi:uncharacterized circularly permuted ATP-grasp superfamily protein/uncharacterized alpha-E superfamily protein